MALIRQVSDGPERSMEDDESHVWIHGRVRRGVLVEVEMVMMDIDASRECEHK
jgi:hypothetical protein